MLLYLLFSEFITENRRLKYHSIGSSVGFSIGYIFISFFIFNENDLNIILVQTAISILLQVHIWRLPESPKFLFANKRYDEVHEALKYISSVNHADSSNIKFEQELDQAQEKNDKKVTGNFMNALKNRKTCINLLVMIVNWGAVGISFQVVTYYVGFFPGNIFVNGLIIITFDIISSAMITPYVNFWGIKNSFISAYAFTFIACCMFLLLKKLVILSYIIVS
jgi:Na+/melibiose symporter-like transporter